MHTLDILGQALEVGQDLFGLVLGPTHSGRRAGPRRVHAGQLVLQELQGWRLLLFLLLETVNGLEPAELGLAHQQQVHQYRVNPVDIPLEVSG